MTTMPPTPLVPFAEANPDTQDDFLRGLRDLRNIDGNPEAWQCAACGETTPGAAILISYGVGDTPIPFCATPGCPGYGPDLKPTTA